MRSQGLAKDLGFLRSHAVVSVRLATLRPVLLALAVCAGAGSAAAAAKDFAGPGNFSEAAKWTGGTLPKTGDNLTIEGGVCVFDDAAPNLEYGSIQVGFKTVASVVWPASGTNTLHVTGIIKSNSGGTIDMTNGGTLRVGSGGWTTTGYTFVAGTGTVEWDNTSGNATLSPALTTFNNMTVLATGRLLSLAGGVTVTGNLTLEAGTFDVTAANYPVTVKGNWINNGGTFVPYTGTVTLNGTSAQSIGGSASTSFNNLTVANTTAAVSADTNVVVSGTLDVTAGAVFRPAAAVVINSGAAAGTVTGSGTLRVTRTASNPDLVNQYRFSTYTLSGLTVDYTGSGAQTVNSTVGSYGALALSGSGTKTLEGAVTDNGTLTIAGGVTLSDAGFALTTKGNVSHAGTHTGTGKILLAGTVPQSLSGAGSYHNLEVNNAGGVALNSAVPVNGALTLTAGLLTTGAHAVQLAVAATASRTGGWVNGYVQKAFVTGSGQTFTFPIGGSANYRPTAVSNLSVTAAGTLTAIVSASVGNHPQIATSGLNPSKTVLRYWTLTAGGGQL